MARFTQLLAHSQFATGSMHYDDNFPGDQVDSLRIVIYAMIGGILAPFIVDTGAPWCVVNPQLVIPLIEHNMADVVGGMRYRVRNQTYEGNLVRVELMFPDEDSDNMTRIDSTVFVPDLREGEQWKEPNFIGLKGCLERICFAVDPGESYFYFGPLQGDPDL